MGIPFAILLAFVFHIGGKVSIHILAYVLLSNSLATNKWVFLIYYFLLKMLQIGTLVGYHMCTLCANVISSDHYSTL